MRLTKIFKLLIVCCLLDLNFMRPLGIDTTERIDLEFLNCMRKIPDTCFTFFRGFMSSGLVDQTGIENNKLAHSQNLATSVYMVPNPSGNALDQATRLCQALWESVPGTKFKIMIDVEHPANWKNGIQGNRQFIKTLVDAMNFKQGCFWPGILTRRADWESIVGPDWHDNLTGAALWYIHENNDPSPRDFEKFGPWTKAIWKQYASNKEMCGHKVNLDSDVINGESENVKLWINDNNDFE